MKSLDNQVYYPNREFISHNNRSKTFVPGCGKRNKKKNHYRRNNFFHYKKNKHLQGKNQEGCYNNNRLLKLLK